ncbi:MAG: DUF5777 family beta-barrel protein [Bacteroidota bacterium]
MKKLKILLLLLFFMPALISAQEAEPVKTKSKPVREPFACPTVIDQQTVYIPTAKTLEFVIEHRFDKIENISNLFGIYGSSNIRLGVNYSITNKLSVGFGTTKFRKLQDLRIKYNILEQTRDDKIPVAVTAYGNMGIDARNESYFGLDYTFTNRLSYFTELIVARKFTDWLSIQFSGSFSHINRVDSLMEHDKIGLSFSGRARVSAQSSVVFNYGIPLEITSIQEHTTLTNPPKHNFGFGWEVSTSTHVFQIFVASATDLSPQYTMMENRNDWLDGGLFFGFTITRLWSF